MSKIWYGKVWNNEGYTYKRFVSVSKSQAETLVNTIKEQKGGYGITNSINADIHLKAPIKQQGKFIFLNYTQAEYIGIAKQGYNTALFIKE